VCASRQEERKIVKKGKRRKEQNPNALFFILKSTRPFVDLKVTSRVPHCLMETDFPLELHAWIPT